MRTLVQVQSHKSNLPNRGVLETVITIFGEQKGPATHINTLRAQCISAEAVVDIPLTLIGHGFGKLGGTIKLL